jgi:hypothetical protein
MPTTTSDRPVYVRDKQVGEIFDGVFVRWLRPSHFFDGPRHGNRQLREKGFGYHVEALAQADGVEILAALLRHDLFVVEFKQGFNDGIPFSGQGGLQLLIPLRAWQRIENVPPNVSLADIARLARRRDLWRPVPIDWTVEGWQPRLLPLRDGP